MSASELPPAPGNRPECFGVSEVVHPTDEEGFSQPRRACVACPHLRPCLREALRSEGVLPAASPAETCDEPPMVSKVSGFIRRWSDRKLSGSNG
jgi:hypothetical protein